MALQDNPRVRVGRLLAMAQHQVVREARSADLPSFDGSITAVDALNASRLADAPLTSSHLFPHAGAGGSFSQLITDFGRTHNLVLTQKLEAEASNANALATREEIVLAADKAFYDALTAQALLQVASRTVMRNRFENIVRRKANIICVGSPWELWHWDRRYHAFPESEDALEESARIAD